MWALLACTALRIAITDRRPDRPGHRPRPGQLSDRRRNAQILVTSARNVVTSAADQAGDIGRASWPACTDAPARVCARNKSRSAAGPRTRPANPHVPAGHQADNRNKQTTSKKTGHAAHGA